MFSFGWWSTGRDQEARILFETVLKAIDSGLIPGKIAYCFISREPGESHASDEFFTSCAVTDVPVRSLSAAKYKPELRKKDREQWRNEYHHEVINLLDDFNVDLVVLAGYMWVVSSEVCSDFSVINLHPALPGGPVGTWQEVIWELLEQRLDSTGVMMHLVTPELDKGPPVTFCSFKIRGGKWDEMWDQFESDFSRLGMQGIKNDWGESYPLFAEIRREGMKRELPLIVYTLRSMAAGKVNFDKMTGAGYTTLSPHDLSDDINRSIEED